MRRFLWITDPWGTLDHPNDTTLRLAEESLRMGHRSFWCDVRTIELSGGRALLETREILSVEPPRTASSFRLSPARMARPREFFSLHYRVDPPIDLAYLHPLQILDLERPALVNPADVLFRGNEKFEAAREAGLLPPTIVGARWERLREFGMKERRTVLKPIHLAQSKGIELLDWSDERRARELVSKATDGFTRPALLQRYLPGIEDGEQRLWFLDGKLLAFARKLPPKKGDFKIDMDHGSRVVSTELSRKERSVALKIGKVLKGRKIRLAAVDLIEGYVTDFNFTSPGLISQMEAATGENLAAKIIARLAAH